MPQRNSVVITSSFLHSNMLKKHNRYRYNPYVLLATISSSSHNSIISETKITGIVKKCLSKLQLHFSLLSHSSKPKSPKCQHLSLFLALFPSLVNFDYKSPEIASLSLEIVGAASLSSLEANQLIALDAATVKALISALSRSNDPTVTVAACDTLLDLSTTSLVVQRLFQFTALSRLMFEFLRTPLSLDSVSICVEENCSAACSRIGFREGNGVAVSFLHAIVTLINMSHTSQLEKIDMSLVDEFCVFLKKVWEIVHHQMLLTDDMKWKSCQDVCLRVSNVRVNSLVESIFRLSICANRTLFTPLRSLLVQQSFFGLGESSFNKFLMHHWESSPTLIRNFCRPTIEDGDHIFGLFSRSLNCNGLFSRSLNCNGSSPMFISSMLRSFVTCPPIASLEFDILNFLEEVRHELGSPIIYQQDIRIVKTEKESKWEVHYFNETSSSSCSRISCPLTHAKIMQCENAYKESYTIALRGMECRFPWVASVADALASLFGQPSVGVNLYLTPPNSQGLARHIDDHCVFVCQILGSKKWTLFPQPDSLLPRLYDLNSQQNVEADNSLSECREFLLQEGDILYIPRGCAHEACTGGGFTDATQFSLHLTFGIEVEPPLEWEGFAHVALYCWSLTGKKNNRMSSDRLPDYLFFMSVNMMHAMIELIGEADPMFRSACLVDALQSTLDQKGIFQHLIQKIDARSSFLDALRKVEVSVAEKEDPFRRMRWLWGPNEEKEAMQEPNSLVPSLDFETLLPVYVKQKEITEAFFLKVKSVFCNEVLYEHVINEYKALLQKYKETRKQYKNGMLSLHMK